MLPDLKYRRFSTWLVRGRNTAFSGHSQGRYAQVCFNDRRIGAGGAWSATLRLVTLRPTSKLRFPNTNCSRYSLLGQNLDRSTKPRCRAMPTVTNWKDLGHQPHQGPSCGRIPPYPDLIDVLASSNFSAFRPGPNRCSLAIGFFPRCGRGILSLSWDFAQMPCDCLEQDRCSSPARRLPRAPGGVINRACL